MSTGDTTDSKLEPTLSQSVQ